mgnify:CR=1 FL=1
MENFNKYLPNLVTKFEIEDMYFPWSRTYEVGLKIKYVGGKKNG